MFWWRRPLKKHYYAYRYIYQPIIIFSVVLAIIGFFVFIAIESDRADARHAVEDAANLLQRRNDAVANVASACSVNITSKFTKSIIGVNTDTVESEANNLKTNCIDSSLYTVVIKKASK